MTSAGVVRQQASDGVLQRGEGRAGERALNRRVVQTDPLLKPEEREGLKQVITIQRRSKIMCFRCEMGGNTKSVSCWA